METSSTDRGEKTSDFFLKHYDQSQHTHAYKLVEYGSEQAQIEYLRNENPNNDEEKNTCEDIGGTGTLHQPINVVHQQGYKQNVYDVFDTKTYHVLFMLTD